MDQASRQVGRFLGTLNAIMQSDKLIRGEASLWMKLTRRGLSPIRGMFPVVWPISHPKTGLAISASVKVTSEKQVDFGIFLYPGDEEWTIETDVLLDLWPEGEGQRSMREFPTRYAHSLEECLTQLESAVADLAACDDILDQIAAMALLSPEDKS